MSQLEQPRFCNISEYAAAYKERINACALEPGQLYVLLTRLRDVDMGYVSTVRVAEVGVMRLGALPVSLVFINPDSSDAKSDGVAFDDVWNSTRGVSVGKIALLDGVFRSSGTSGGVDSLGVARSVTTEHIVDLTKTRELVSV